MTLITTWTSLRYLGVVGVSFALTAEIDWLLHRNVSNDIATIIGFGSAIALGWISVSRTLNSWRRERLEQERADESRRKNQEFEDELKRRKQEFDQELERRQRLEVVEKESLSVQFDKLRKQTEEEGKVSQENQTRMRATLHDISNQAQLARVENESLRSDLSNANRSFLEASKQLAEANGRIAALTAELALANQRIAQLSSDVLNLNRAAENRVTRMESMVEAKQTAAEPYKPPPLFVDPVEEQPSQDVNPS
jgi:chromosome segregation ATPase